MLPRFRGHPTSCGGGHHDAEDKTPLGFVTMAVFGLGLSLPLAMLAVSPAASSLATRLMSGRPAMRWVFAIVFLALGAWSIWFGLFVDPADWSTL